MRRSLVVVVAAVAALVGSAVAASPASAAGNGFLINFQQQSRGLLIVVQVDVLNLGGDDPTQGTTGGDVDLRVKVGVEPSTV